MLYSPFNHCKKLILMAFKGDSFNILSIHKRNIYSDGSGWNLTLQEIRVIRSLTIEKSGTANFLYAYAKDQRTVRDKLCAHSLSKQGNRQSRIKLLQLFALNPQIPMP